MKLLVSREGPFATNLLKHPTWWMFFTTRNDDYAFSSFKPGNKPRRAAYILTQINSKYSILPFHLPLFKTKNQIDKDTDPKQAQSVRRTKSNHQTRPRRLLPLLGSTVTFESFRWWPYIHEETGYRQERYFIGWRGFRFLPRHPIVLENAGLLLAAIVYQDLSRWNPLSSLFPAVCRVQAK